MDPNQSSSTAPIVPTESTAPIQGNNVSTRQSAATAKQPFTLGTQATIIPLASAELASPSPTRSWSYTKIFLITIVTVVILTSIVIALAVSCTGLTIPGLTKQFSCVDNDTDSETHFPLPSEILL